MVDLNLTKRQKEIFEFVKRYSAKHGYPPTVSDLGKAIGLTSSSTVHAHLANLEKLGMLRRDPSKPRAIELLVDKAKAAVTGAVPVVGQVAAGQPVLAEENIEEYVSVPQLAGGDEGEYVLRIRGESMKDAGILDGDLVLGQMGPMLGGATVEKVAVAAVMAGCTPDHIPVVVAAVRAVCDPAFDLTEMQGTTHCIAPLLIVSKLDAYDYAGATAIAVVLLLASFVALLAINLLQLWTVRRSASEAR